MDLRTPADWISIAADAAGDRPALLVPGGPIDYRTLDREIDERVRSLPAMSGIVPVRASLDLPGVVDLMAHFRAGVCVHPVAPDGPVRSVPGSVDAVVCLETSGTSGAPRFVPLTMANLTASVRASALRLGTNADDRWLACLPLHHIGGLSVLFRSFAAGGTAIIAPFGDAIAGVIEATEPTMASLVPTMVHRLLSWDGASLATIGRVLVGGAHLDMDLARAGRNAGARLLPTYGMTEASSQVATAHSPDWPDVDGYVGHPLDGFTVTVEASFGDVGSVAIEGAAVFGGYLGEAPREGAFVTNDLGSLGSDGALRIVGRADDVIVSGGENVSLRSVERTVRSIEGVESAVAVGIADPEWGAVVGMMAVSDRSSQELASEARDLLAPHERPRSWVVTSTIPLLANGKPDLPAVRDAFDEGPPSR